MGWMYYTNGTVDADGTTFTPTSYRIRCELRTSVAFLRRAIPDASPRLVDEIAYECALFSKGWTGWLYSVEIRDGITTHGTPS